MWRDVETLVIITLMLIIVLSVIIPSITDKGYIKPLVVIDPVHMTMSVEKNEVLSYENVTHYAYYNYAYIYLLPVKSVMEVDVEGLVASRPIIFYRQSIPPGINFTPQPVKNYDILDNLDNLTVNTAYVFKYTWWSTEHEGGTKGIGFLAQGGFDAERLYIHSGVGDPQGPDFVEPTAYGKFYVIPTSTGFSLGGIPQG